MIQSYLTGELQPVYWRVLQYGSYWVDYSRLFTDSTSGSITIPQPSLTDEDGMRQNLSEAWVTYILWNLWDGKEFKDLSDPPDPITLGTEEIYKALASRRYLYYGSYNANSRNAYGTDLVDFVDAVLCDSSDSIVSGIEQMLQDEQFPYDNAPVCAE